MMVAKQAWHIDEKPTFPFYEIIRHPDQSVHCFYYWQEGARESVEHKAHHSPDGFEYGYSGSGPADLALSILNHFFHLHHPVKRQPLAQIWKGYVHPKAWELHQVFKEIYLTAITDPGALINESEIATWYLIHETDTAQVLPVEDKPKRSRKKKEVVEEEPDTTADEATGLIDMRPPAEMFEDDEGAEAAIRAALADPPDIQIKADLGIAPFANLTDEDEETFMEWMNEIEAQNNIPDHSAEGDAPREGDDEPF